MLALFSVWHSITQYFLIDTNTIYRKALDGKDKFYKLVQGQHQMCSWNGAGKREPTGMSGCTSNKPWHCRSGPVRQQGQKRSSGQAPAQHSHEDSDGVAQELASLLRRKEPRWHSQRPHVLAGAVLTTASFLTARFLSLHFAKPFG